jgi:hypothetical protein
MTIEVRDAHGSVMDVKSPSRLPASIRPLEIGPEAARRTTGFNNNAVGLTTGGRTEWPLKLGPIRQDWGGRRMRLFNYAPSSGDVVAS